MALKLPRPIRRWLRKRYSQSQERPLAEQAAASASSSSSSSRGGARLQLPTPFLLALVLIGAVLAASTAWQAYQSGSTRLHIATPGQIGGLHIVFLTGGQFFIGNIESVDRGTVILSDVFYVQTAGNQTPTLPSAAQPAPARGAQIVRRMDGDWHQPDRMAIPIDRVMIIETVGRDSLVAKLVGEARARQGATN